MTDIHLKYREAISSVLSVAPDNIYLYWKGRVALYALLKAAGISNGDEVLISGLTCVVVPNAVIYLGAKPVFIDVSAETNNPDFDSYIEKITDKTRVIIIQNTFGLSSEVEKIAFYAKNHNILTIEDCTHGFGGMFNDKPNGSYCDAAIFSTQWNKPYSTGIGGFSVVHNPELIICLEEVNKKLIKPSIKDELILWSLVWAKRLLINDKSFWTLRGLYRTLSKANIVIGSSQGVEIEGIEIPDDYFKSASLIQSRFGLRNIKRIKRDIIKRRENSILYSLFLIKYKKKYINEVYWDNHSFLVYPLLVEDRESFMIKAEKNHIKLGDWFISPIHPVKQNFSKWELDIESLPNASFLSKHMVNLPTLSNKIENVLTFLRNNINDIL
jgi:dTDP-4-amino-4,6-dideoxygalactose transaminase